jgi:hypothetical protein
MIYVSFDIGLKNLALCILREEREKVSIIDWEVICLAESKKQFKGINNISDVIYCELDNIVGKLESINIKYIDKVIIENQPSNLNGIMKTIQHLIFSYFNLLRHWDKRVGEVILINPTIKLLHHSFEPTLQKEAKTTKQEKYKINKANGIEVCSYYVQNDEVLKRFLLSHKKKDDLSDTCLQTVAYIRKNGNNIEDVLLDDHNFLT